MAGRRSGTVDAVARLRRPTPPSNTWISAHGEHGCRDGAPTLQHHPAWPWICRSQSYKFEIVLCKGAREQGI
jgi:hypothetical protein